jgi:hypothetical protein
LYERAGCRHFNRRMIETDGLRAKIHDPSIG